MEEIYAGVCAEGQIGPCGMCSISEEKKKVGFFCSK